MRSISDYLRIKIGFSANTVLVKATVLLLGGTRIVVSLT
jgi:hypothetical protein